MIAGYARARGKYAKTPLSLNYNSLIKITKWSNSDGTTVEEVADAAVAGGKAALGMSSRREDVVDIFLLRQEKGLCPKDQRIIF